jgi:hypothetical protein
LFYTVAKHVILFQNKRICFTTVQNNGQLTDKTLVFENQGLKQIFGLKIDDIGCGHTGCEFMRLLVARIRTVFAFKHSYDQGIHT